MKEAIRHFIVNKAKGIFAIKGYSNTTIEEIAEAATISKPTLYNYFKGKEDIFYAVLEMHNKELDQLIDPILQNNELSFIVKFTKIIRDIVHYSFQNRSFFQIVLNELKMFFEIITREDLGGLKKFMEIKEKRNHKLLQLLNEGLQSGIIDEKIPIDFIVFYLNSIVHEFCYHYISSNINESKYTPDQIADLIIKISCKGFMKNDIGG